MLGGDPAVEVGEERNGGGEILTGVALVVGEMVQRSSGALRGPGSVGSVWIRPSMSPSLRLAAAVLGSFRPSTNSVTRTARPSSADTGSG